MIYVVGHTEVDEHCYEIRRHGRLLPVQPQVFNVLHYLIVNRYRVVPKAELLEALWPDQHVSESTLTQRIRSARRALEDSHQRQHSIKTLYGRGYRFVAQVEERHPVASATEPVPPEIPQACEATPVTSPVAPQASCCPLCHPPTAPYPDSSPRDQTSYRDLIETTLTNYAKRLSDARRLRMEVVFDRDRNRYLLINVGWHHNKRVYRNRIHIDILGDKVWIQHHDTNIDLVTALIQAGIAESNIVLGYCPPKRRDSVGVHNPQQRPKAQPILKFGPTVRSASVYENQLNPVSP